MPYHDYERHLMGSAKITPKGSFEVGSMQSFQLIYTSGKFGIDDQGGLMIGLRPHFDGSKLQQDNPKAEGYITVESSKKIPIPFWDNKSDCLKASSALLASTNAINKAGKLYPVNLNK